MEFSTPAVAVCVLLAVVTSEARAVEQSAVLAGAFALTGERSRFDDTGSDVDTRSYNLDLGMISDFGLSIGAKFLEIEQVAALTGTDYRSEAKIRGVGVSAGFRHGSGLFVQSAYLPRPTKHLSDETTSEDTVFSGGTGWTFDVGFLFSLAPWFGIGPQMSWTQVTYVEASYDGAAIRSLDGTLFERYFTPMVALAAFL